MSAGESESERFGKIIAEEVHRVQMGHYASWERTMRLHVKPKPAWIPQSAWAKVLNLCLTQTETTWAPRAEGEK